MIPQIEAFWQLPPLGQMSFILAAVTAAGLPVFMKHGLDFRKRRALADEAARLGEARKSAVAREQELKDALALLEERLSTECPGRALASAQHAATLGLTEKASDIVKKAWEVADEPFIRLAAAVNAAAAPDAPEGAVAAELLRVART